MGLLRIGMTLMAKRAVSGTPQKPAADSLKIPLRMLTERIRWNDIDEASPKHHRKYFHGAEVIKTRDEVGNVVSRDSAWPKKNPLGIG